jgi:hypothetical protein
MAPVVIFCAIFLLWWMGVFAGGFFAKGDANCGVLMVNLWCDVWQAWCFGMDFP